METGTSDIDGSVEAQQRTSTASFQALGKTVRQSHGKEGLEVFGRPLRCSRVTMESEEVTSLCPVTSQPDWYSVSISYIPHEYCLESKSLKLYFWGLRDQGLFCEDLAAKIMEEIAQVLKPTSISVVVQQRPRGGIGITAEAQWPL